MICTIVTIFKSDIVHNLCVCVYVRSRVCVHKVNATKVMKFLIIPKYKLLKTEMVKSLTIMA